MLVDCREALAREGLAALQCGAFHIQTAGRRYFNTTPLGRAVTGTLLVQRDARARRRDLGRRLDLQGQRHRALLPLRPAREPERCASTSRGSTARSSSELGGRKEMSEWLAARGLPHGTSVEKAYSTDANLLGATHEAKDLELLSTSMKIVEPIMGVAPLGPGGRDRAGDGDDPVRERRARRGRRLRARATRSRSSGRRTRSAAATGSGCPTRSRTGSSRRRAAASTRRPGWRCSTSPTSGC